ncbi:MAG: hypothetical protein KIG44_06445 [Eubacteriales bacterium]|nr:hypothetical protein [Eubacteriales bacterium]
MEDNKKKNTEKLSEWMQKTVDVSKKATLNVKKGIENAIEKAKIGALRQKLKKLNPVFPAQYEDKNFNLPNMIMIVDDAVRRGNKLCDGAIGWLATNGGMEMLCLYDEAVEFSKLTFIPAAICDAIYYVDSFDRSKFIRTDCIFSKAHEEKIAELKHIAYCLGAKNCSIEIYEAQSGDSVRQIDASAKEIKGKSQTQESFESNSVRRESNVRSGKDAVVFEDNSNCKQPELKWFLHDENIKRLIEMRLSGEGSLKSETLELSGVSSATMSQKTAYAIDSAIGKGSVSMSSQAEKEYHSKLLYHIEF